jgi:predicted Zn-dependent peptidase
MPDVHGVKDLKVPPPHVWHLSNGTPVYETNMGTQEIVKLELVFLAGRPFEEKQLVARATLPMLKEGTKSFPSGQIAETLDFYGGTLSTPINLDTGNLLLYSLGKHFGALLPLLAEVISAPVFPQSELDTFIQRNQQRLQVDLTKNDVVAFRKFTEMLYPEGHPYGYNSLPETYSALTREDLVQHFKRNYTAGNCLIFLSGKISDKERQLLDKHLGPVMLSGEKREVSLAPANETPEQIRVPHPDVVQTSVRIGCPMFGRQHEDFTGMYVLNTILGGYFGSRLMANIREDKGYTYNIYSSHDAMRYGGYFCVASDVGNEFVEDTVKQIYLEMEKLQHDFVPASELEMVKNYLLGTMLTNLDGPFNTVEVVKTFVQEDMPVSTFEEMAETIKYITPETLRTLAQRYFSKEKMWEVIV